MTGVEPEVQNISRVRLRPALNRCKDERTRIFYFHRALRVSAAYNTKSSLTVIYRVAAGRDIFFQIHQRPLFYIGNTSFLFN